MLKIWFHSLPLFRGQLRSNLVDKDVANFAQWRYTNQWSYREVVLLLVENWIPIPRLGDVKYHLLCQFLQVPRNLLYSVSQCCKNLEFFDCERSISPRVLKNHWNQTKLFCIWKYCVILWNIVKFHDNSMKHYEVSWQLWSFMTIQDNSKKYYEVSWQFINYNSRSWIF